MDRSKVLAFTTILLFLAVSSSAEQGDSLRGNAAGGVEDGRNAQLFGGIFSSVGSLYNSVVSIVLRFPQAVLGFIVSLAIFLKNIILGTFVFLFSSVTQTTSTLVTMPASTTTTGMTTTIADPMTTTSAISTASSVASSVMTTADQTTSTAVTVPEPTNTMTSENPTSSMTSTSISAGPSSTATSENPTASVSTSPTTMTTSALSTTTTTTSTSSTTTTTTSIPTKTAFLATNSGNGNLGGIEGADLLCNAQAAAADLKGVYLSWLSNATTSPSERFNRSTIPYVLVDGTIIANNYSSLVSGTLLAPINKDAQGGLIMGPLWTGTFPNGTSIGTNSDSHCDGWTSMAGLGRIGGTTSQDAGWTNEDCAVTCSNVAFPFYCFEQ